MGGDPPDLGGALERLRDGQGPGRKRARLALFRDGEAAAHWLLALSPAPPAGNAPCGSSWPPTPTGAGGRPPFAKVGLYGEALRAERAAVAEGFDGVLFEDPGGRPAEALFANLFLFGGGKAWTPGERPGMLAGITRRHFARYLGSSGGGVSSGMGGGEVLDWAESALLVSSVKVWSAWGRSGGGCTATGSGRSGPTPGAGRSTGPATGRSCRGFGFAYGV